MSQLRHFRTPPDFQALEAKMNIDQLEAFCNSPAHVRQVALTVEGARSLFNEIRTLLGKEPEAFEIDVRRTQRPVDFTLMVPKVRRFLAEEAEFAKRRGALDAGGRS